MRLEIGEIKIKDIIFGDVSKVEEGVLYINQEDIKKIVMADDKIKSLNIEIAKPGESVRITPVKDVIEPRVKVEGNGGAFPGILSKTETVGSGRTHVLKDMGVVTCGKIVGFQEGIIDMQGPGADYTPFSKLNNLCLVIEPNEGLESHVYEASVRMAGLKVSEFIGNLAKEVTPDDVLTYETKPIFEQAAQYPDLPKVGYVYMLQTQGLLHDTYVYGVDAKKIIPTILYPTEVMDGAIISGNCVSACDKNTTYHHLNNPIIKSLYAKHGKEINFMGIIVTNENVFLADKVRSSDMTAKLCEYLGLDGAIVSQEGFGNPDTDLIMNCKKIETKGIKTVIVTDEYAGRDGASQSLADADKLADAVVTGGNANELITLPPMDRIIGMTSYTDTIAGGFDGSLREDGSIVAEIQVITGATNELGFNRLTAKSY
ncbi:glycine/sarcosine/betaine reductase component B subunit [uncultured Cetobacterium sp.]|uniref:glycine/sarcosine/betaine reductase component B subunit n=1 Tax=uncultured Cetobacterium sp. TaxID=527638 RepID=UPI00261E4AB9|nr:glycine/sarcosine/betaine reductase component B subunit [uncultured Cetobacterium sp.]